MKSALDICGQHRIIHNDCGDPDVSEPINQFPDFLDENLMSRGP